MVYAQENFKLLDGPCIYSNSLAYYFSRRFGTQQLKAFNAILIIIEFCVANVCLCLISVGAITT